MFFPRSRSLLGTANLTRTIDNSPPEVQELLAPFSKIAQRWTRFRLNFVRTKIEQLSGDSEPDSGGIGVSIELRRLSFPSGWPRRQAIITCNSYFDYHGTPVSEVFVKAQGQKGLESLTFPSTEKVAEELEYRIGLRHPLEKW